MGVNFDIFQEILDRQIAEERERYQPSTAEKIFATVKSLLLRGLIIYFVMTMFRRPQQQPNTSTETGAKIAKGDFYLLLLFFFFFENKHQIYRL